MVLINLVCLTQFPTCPCHTSPTPFAPGIVLVTLSSTYDVSPKVSSHKPTNKDKKKPQSVSSLGRYGQFE